MRGRVSNKIGTEGDFIQYLIRKYGVSPGEIAFAQHKLKSVTHGWVVDIPVLRKMCDYKEQLEENYRNIKDQVEYSQ